MHDIDRIRLETQSETGVFEAGPFEAEATYGETGEVFGEAEQLELASELLGVTSEAELDRFLGDLIGRAGKAIGKFVRSPEGQAIGGILKGAAKQTAMTRLLSFNPEPFEAKSEMNGALLTQWLTRGKSVQQTGFRREASSARSPHFGIASAASGAERWPQPAWEIGGTAVARPSRRRPTRPALPLPPGRAAFDAEALRKKAVEIAKQELARWGNGKIKETDPRLRQTLQDYWKTGTGASFSQDPARQSGLSKSQPLERSVYFLAHEDSWRRRCLQIWQLSRRLHARRDRQSACQQPQPLQGLSHLRGRTTCGRPRMQEAGG